MSVPLQEAPFALALSHDVDRIKKRWQFLYYLSRTLVQLDGVQARQHIRSLVALLRGDDPYWNFPRIMELEEELGVRSTFFFLDESGRPSLFHPRSQVLYQGRYSVQEERVAEIIRELQAGDWEIGLHGSYESYHDEILLRREKSRLEAVLGAPVRGIRQHYLNLDVPETWQIQARAGLLYDSSLGFRDRVGFRWGTSRPFHPRHPLTGVEIPILEIPLAIMDEPLMRAGDPWRKALDLIERVEQEHGVLTINWHQRVFNPWEYHEVQDMYIRIIRECQRRGAWAGPLGAIAEA